MAGRHNGIGIGTYDHLGEDNHNNIRAVVMMDELADSICALNYGVHRFLSALVRARERQAEAEAKTKYPPTEPDALACQIERLLNEGYY